jgi:hypothetical protein
MTRDFGIRECARCGKTITAFCPSLPTLSSIGENLDKPEATIAKKLAELEDAPIQIVLEYIRHRMRPECEIVYGIYPKCGGHLATRCAKQCLDCHSSWHHE